MVLLVLTVACSRVKLELRGGREVLAVGIRRFQSKNEKSFDSTQTQLFWTRTTRATYAYGFVFAGVCR